MAEITYHYDDPYPWIEDVRSKEEWLALAEELSQKYVGLPAKEAYRMIQYEEGDWIHQLWTDEFRSYMWLVTGE